MGGAGQAGRSGEAVTITGTSKVDKRTTAGLWLPAVEFLAQDGVDHGVPPRAARVQVPPDGAFLDHPGRPHGPDGCLVERAARTPDPVQAEFGEAEALQEADGFQSLALTSASFLSATATMYSVLGSAVADLSAPLMIAATCSMLRGSKLRCRVASSLP